MAIENKNMLVWLKAMSRGQALPLDASEVHDSFEDAQLYSSSPNAYAGQTIKALLEDNKYHEYVLQPSGIGYSLEEVGFTSDNKQYVKVVDVLPSSDQMQGVVYIEINTFTGYIWNGFGWIKVFYDVDPIIAQLEENVRIIGDSLDEKAPIDNPSFTGLVTVRGEEIAIKSYVDGLFARLGETISVPDILDPLHPLPNNYKSGKTYRVAENGFYAGQECEVGDLIIVIADYNEVTASDNDFIVLQSNIDGAVTSAVDITAVGEIVMFDSVTGKVINASGINVASLKDAISKSHGHTNKSVIDTYSKTQDEIMADAQVLVNTLGESITLSLEKKADKSTTIAGYGIIDAYTASQTDVKFKSVTDHINTKTSHADVDAKIATSKNETLSEAAAHLEVRVGYIADDITIKSYIDESVNDMGGYTDIKIGDAMASAIQESTHVSKLYTDSKVAKITEALTITEF